MIRAGELRHIIEIQERTESTDGYGGKLFTWTEFATVRAKFAPIKGRELTAAKAEYSEGTVRFYIRYLSGVTAKMRIIYNGQVYEIKAQPINTEGMNRELEILATVIE